MLLPPVYAQLAPIWHAYAIQPQGNGFEHSATVLVLDKHGRQRVSFPVDQHLSREEQDYVIETVREFYRNRR